MEEKIDVERVFQLLEANDDVLLFDRGDTFTLAKFRELLMIDFRARMELLFQIDNKNNPHQFSALSTNDLLANLKPGAIDVKRSELKWNSTLLDCQFLKIGSKGWEKGKLRIQIIYTSKFDNKRTFINGRNYDMERLVKVHIEFSPDEPPKPESPLDDLRQLPEYKQQS